MHPETEQLLAVRDGHAPPDVRAHVDGCDACGAEVARLGRMRGSLQALPRLSPPPRVLEALLDARAEERRARRRKRDRRYAGLALAASVVMTVALLVMPRGDDPAPPLIAVNGEVPALVARSAELDRLLTTVEAGTGILDLRTAGTIIALEDRIAIVDAHLRRADSLGRPADADLLRQRIELVEALVDVHAAQTQYSF